jgi:flagellar hook-associated protein 3 FlgL
MMSLRTSSTDQNSQALLDLQRTQERLAQNTTRISSGNRITSIGDDPTASASILDLSNSIGANTEFSKQADTALAYLQSSEDAVSAAISDTTRLIELSANGSSASDGELDAIRSNLVALANTQSQGKYIFGGTNTQAPPFSSTVPVAYSGNQGSINLNVTAVSSVTMNVPGDSVFLGSPGAVAGPTNHTDIFQAVTNLKSVFDGNPPATVPPTTIQSVTADLNAILANLNKVQADLGGRQAGLNDLKNTLSGTNVTLAGIQSNLQATDYPAAMTQYTADQTMQSATLSTMAKTNQMNLFNYLT